MVFPLAWLLQIYGLVMTNSLRGKLIQHAPLTDFTAWRVGGAADKLYQPADLNDLETFLRLQAPDEQIIWLGLGSNTLVRDGGIRGTVIVTQPRLNQLTQINEMTIRAEAGVACPAFARFSARQNLEGAEFLAGIPGTMGGALAMNAGCHGGETWGIVHAVETIDRQGQRHLRYPSDYQVAYRHVKGEADEWFVAGYFRLKKGNKENALNQIRALLKYREDTQPLNEPNCGSVFRNPPQDYAARLIETAGLKGKQIGGAFVSTKHANFITTKPGAIASDVELLIQFVMETVKDIHHIDLIREVHIIGEA